MSSLKNAKAEIAAKQAAKSNQTSNTDKPKAKLWINVGVETEEFGFIKLPYGLPLDTMPNSTDEYDTDRAFLMNALLEDVLAGCEGIDKGVDLDPDEVFTDMKLVIRIYHSKVATETKMTESERQAARKVWKK